MSHNDKVERVSTDPMKFVSAQKKNGSTFKMGEDSKQTSYMDNSAVKRKSG